jgi:carbon-monoxide dehydrogenase small subunit
MSARAFLEENPDPTRAEIKAALADNICRCTGYENIFEAVERAAENMEGD